MPRSAAQARRSEGLVREEQSGVEKREAPDARQIEANELIEVHTKLARVATRSICATINKFQQITDQRLALGSGTQVMHGETMSSVHSWDFPINLAPNLSEGSPPDPATRTEYTS